MRSYYPYYQQMPMYPYPGGGIPNPGYPQMPVMPPDFGMPEPPGLVDHSSYLEDILRLNKGKIATVYMNFENSQWGSKIFKGRIEGVGKDHLILTDVTSSIRYILLTLYLNYITFDEDLNCHYSFDPMQMPPQK